MTTFGSSFELSPGHFKEQNVLEASIRSITPRALLVASKRLRTSIGSLNIGGFIRRLITVTTDRDNQRAFLDAIKKGFAAVTGYTKAHPYKTVLFIIAFILILNPILLLGFGAAGPIAGSIAAAAQAGIGSSVAAGSGFAILQSIGMTCYVGIPVMGLVLGAAVVLGELAWGWIKSGWDRAKMWWRRGKNHHE